MEEIEGLTGSKAMVSLGDIESRTGQVTSQM